MLGANIANLLKISKDILEFFIYEIVVLANDNHVLSYLIYLCSGDTCTFVQDIVVVYLSGS